MENDITNIEEAQHQTWNNERWSEEFGGPIVAQN